MLLLAVDVENHLMFYKIRTILNPIAWLIPLHVCIIIFCVGLLFTKHVYSANGQGPQGIQCVPLIEKNNLVAKLENEMGEVSIFVGASSKDIHTIEVFVNPNTKNWTVLGTNLMKVCILDFGIHGQIKKLKALGQGV